MEIFFKEYVLTNGILASRDFKAQNQRFGGNSINQIAKELAYWSTKKQKSASRASSMLMPVLMQSKNVIIRGQTFDEESADCRYCMNEQRCLQSDEKIFGKKLPWKILVV